jgi:hypothetical protein
MREPIALLGSRRGWPVSPVGLTKAIVGIDRAPAATVEARRAICQQCDRATRHKDGVRVLKCLECSCWIKLKTRLAGERCPLGKW